MDDTYTDNKLWLRWCGNGGITFHWMQYYQHNVAVNPPQWWTSFFGKMMQSKLEADVVKEYWLDDRQSCRVGSVYNLVSRNILDPHNLLNHLQSKKNMKIESQNIFVILNFIPKINLLINISIIHWIQQVTNTTVFFNFR